MDHRFTVELKALKQALIHPRSPSRRERELHYTAQHKRGNDIIAKHTLFQELSFFLDYMCDCM